MFGRAQACITELQLDPEHWLTAFRGPVSAPSTSSASAAPGPYCAVQDPEQKTSDTLRSWKQSAMIFEIPSSFSKPHPLSLPSLRGQETTVCIPSTPARGSSGTAPGPPHEPLPPDGTDQPSIPEPVLPVQPGPALSGLGFTGARDTVLSCFSS